MGSLELLIFLCLIRFSRAVWCNDSVKGEPCCGDFCYTERAKSEKGEISIERRGCLRGSIYGVVRNKCFNDKKRSYCICGEDYCNRNDSLFPGWKEGFLNCSNPKERWTSAYTTTECIECSHILFDEIFADIGTEMRGCRTLDGYYQSYSIMSTPTLPWMQPQSCVRIQIGERDFVQCLCDTGSQCNKKIASEQQLNSTKVSCFYKDYNRWNDDGNKTCQGDVCFITTAFAGSRGCLTNNETLYPGLVQPGYATFRDREYILCDTDKCNENWETAKEAVKFQEPSCIATIATTPMSEPEMAEAEFRMEWAKMLNSISSAFNSFISQFHGFHG